jgi:hypothetical protein
MNLWQKLLLKIWTYKKLLDVAAAGPNPERDVAMFRVIGIIKLLISTEINWEFDTNISNYSYE